LALVAFFSLYLLAFQNRLLIWQNCIHARRGRPSFSSFKLKPLYDPQADYSELSTLSRTSLKRFTFYGSSQSRMTSSQDYRRHAPPFVVLFTPVGPCERFSGAPGNVSTVATAFPCFASVITHPLAFVIRRHPPSSCTPALAPPLPFHPRTPESDGT